MVINIMNLYKYKEILENINIIVIFSIPIISLILYTLNKRKVMILENLIYIGEFFIYLYLNSYIIIGNINLISMILILKFVIILTLKEKLKINNFLYNFFFICLSPFSQKNHFRLSLFFSSLRYISFRCSARGLSERKGEKK